MNRNEYEKIRKNREQYKISNNKYKCPICCNIFTIKGFVVHLLKKHVNFENGIKNSGGFNGHYKDPVFLRKLSAKSKQRQDKKYGIKIKKKVCCFKCHKEFEIYEREKDKKKNIFVPALVQIHIL